MPSELHDLTISALAPMLKSKKISPVEVTASVLKRIETLEPRLKAFITIDHDAALKAAQRAQRQIRKGNYLGPLHGIPITLKDLFQTKGLRTTGGSKILQDWVPDEDAASVAKLRAAGAIIVGKTNLHEFAFGGTTQNPHYGGAKNPYNTEHIPGGSSGGSAIAVATGMCIASTGSDTGGSIRTPSALCGIVGFKPTYGRVSLHGIIPLAWSLDHIGPMTKCVRDAALMLSVMAGYDPKDSSSSKEKVPQFVRSLQNDVKKLRVGIEPSFCFSGVDEEVEQGFKNALKLLEKLGAKIVEVSLPSIELTSAIESVIITTEAASYHEDNLRNRPLDYGEDVRVLLGAGAAFSGIHYLKAQRIRNIIRKEFAEAFKKMDVFALPGAAVPAPKIGASTLSIKGMETDTQMALLRFTCPSNLTGLPAISVPCGMTKERLPVSLQLVGRAFDEQTVLRAAFTFEENSERLPRPALS